MNSPVPAETLRNPRSAPRRGILAFLDSGIGGVPYLRGMRQELAGYPCIYLADLANFPYGEKSEEAVRRAVCRGVDILEEWRPGALVLACNTASVTALDAVRKLVSYPVVGVVPAVKPAAALSRSRSVAILATRRTLEDPYLDGLIREYAGDCRILRREAGELVRFVEERFLGAPPEETDAVLAPHVQALRKAGADAVVLGCTHFLYLREALQRQLGPEVQVVDSVAGVTRQLVRQVHRAGLAPEAPLSAGDLFVNTGREAPETYRGLAAWGGLVYGGTRENRGGVLC